MEPIKSATYDGKQRNLYPAQCEVCGATYYAPSHRLAKRRFCSLDCTRKGTRTRETLTCAWCQTPFERIPSKLDRSKYGLSFCSRDCKNKAQSIDGIESIRPGHFTTGKSVYRQRAIKEYGAKCRQCGYDQCEAMLDVDHKDNNRANNALDNLDVLCVWCHALKTRKVPNHGRLV